MISMKITPDSNLADFAGTTVKLGDAIEKVQAAKKDWYERNKEKVLAAQKESS